MKKGTLVVVVAGRKALEKTGTVFWYGPNKFGEGMRVGIKLESGETEWLNAEYVKVLEEPGGAEETEADKEAEAASALQDEPTTADLETVELELHTRKEHKLFTSRIEGTTLINNTAKKGNKGRTTKKDYKTLAAARKARDRAVKAKFRQGYFPLEAGEGALPLPMELDDSEVERGPRLVALSLPSDRDGYCKAIRNSCPPQLDQHAQRFGSYDDGPGDWNLWWQPAKGQDQVVLNVGRRHFIERVKPALRGDRYSDFPLSLLEPHPFRPDGEALLVAHDKTLYEVELATAEATALHAFDARAAFENSTFLYDHSGQRVLYSELSTVVSLDRATGACTPVIEVEGEELVQDLVRLSDGLLAVLQPSRLSIFRRGEDGAWTRTHEMPCREAVRVDAVLGGKVLAVFSTAVDCPRATVFFGVKDGALYELHASQKRYRRVFDYRGAQWAVESAPGGYVDWTKHRVYNLEAVYDKLTAEQEPLAADHVIDLPSLHDLLAPSNKLTPEAAARKIQAQLERMPQTLEHRQQRSDDLETSPSWQTPLHYAAVRSPLSLVKLLLDAGAEVEAFSSKGETPLVGALQQRRFEAVELLLERGASLVVPDVVTVEGQEVKTQPPIVAAARLGEQELVLRALEAGASIDARGRSADKYDDSKRERLHTPITAALTGAGPSWSAKQPHVELVELLLERGASLSPGPECLSPLEAAEHSEELMNRLLELGADASGPTGSRLLLYGLGERDGHEAVPYAEKAQALIAAGATTDAPHALVLACKLKARCEYFDKPYTDAMGLQIVEGLIAGGADPNHGVPLCNAVSYPQPDLKIIDALLAAGAELDALDAKRITPLRYAIGQNEDDTLANLLLDRGASVARGEGDWSPLHDAVWVGKLELAARLLEQGASLEETTSDGRTPLCLAAWNNQVDAMRWLLSRGAEPDGGETGWSALMAAARKDSVEGITLLLDAGADPERKGTLPWDENDTTERTAQEHAEAEGAAAAAEALGQRTGKAFASLHKAVEADALAEVQRLLAEGAGADKADGQHQRRPAHLARSRAVLEALLDAGADVDGQDKYGNTPLILAAGGQGPEPRQLVALLVQRGAKLEKRARLTQQTPLSAAAQGGDVEIVEALMEAGAKVKAKGRSPLHAAAAGGHAAVIKLLLGAGAEVDAWSGDLVGKRTPLGEAAYWGHLEAARLLLAAGASSSKQDDTPGDDEDEDYWCNGGYTPTLHAVAQGHYDTLKLLLTEDDGGLYAETANHSFAEELTDDPRCKALVTAVMNGKTVAEFEADEAAGQAKAAEVRAGAEASDDLYLQKVAAPDVPHGDRQLPRGVKLGYSDWSVLFPSGYAFCLISSMGKYEAKVADGEGLHELPERMVQATFNYCQSADATRMLLVAEQRVFEIDLATRALRVLYEAERSVKCAGYAGDGVYVLDSEELCYLRYAAGEGRLEAAWSLPRGPDLKEMEATGAPLVCIVPKSDPRRVVLATLDGEGLRHHARVDLASSLTRVWYHRGPDDEQVRVFTMDSWTDADATFYELHNVGVTGRGAPASQVLPDKAAVEALPLTAIVE